MNITSIKKVAAAGALSSVVLLSGCSIPFFGGEEPAVSTETAKTQAEQNPENLFFDFAKARGEYVLEESGLADFDKELLVKSEGKFNISGDFDMEGVPMVNGGTGTFGLDVNAIMDYSNEEDPKLQETFGLKVNALGGLVKVDAGGELRIVNKSAFAQLTKADANFPGQTPEINEIIQKFVNKWYGNTFEEINTLVNEGGAEGFDIQKLLTGSAKPMQDAIFLLEDIAKNPQNYVNFVKFIEEKDGYFYFEATAKKETYEKIGEIIKTFTNNAGMTAGLEQSGINIEEEIAKIIEKIATESVTLAYTPEHPEYFKVFKTIDKDGTTVSAENTEAGCKISIAKKEGDDAGEVTFSKDANGKFSLIVDIPTEYNGERTELLSGTKTEDTLNFVVSAPMYDSESRDEKVKEVVKGNFSKSGNAWAGEITTPQFEDGKLLISEASATKTTAHAKLSAQYKEKTITNIVIDFSSKKPATVNIATPENVSPFSQIQSDVETELNALYGLDEETPEAQETTIDGQNIEVKSGNSEVKIDNNNGNIEIKTKTDELNINTDVSTDADKAEADADAQGGADYSAIQADLARMAELTSENPNNERAKNEFLEVKARVDAYATENDIPKEKLKEMLMEEIVKQVK